MVSGTTGLPGPRTRDIGPLQNYDHHSVRTVTENLVYHTSQQRNGRGGLKIKTFPGLAQSINYKGFGLSGDGASRG